MQFKKIWIKDYKNLKDFSLDFEEGNNLSILIGNNGSGKSNVLEAISGIFTEWYGKSSSIFNTDYRIEYNYDGKEVVLEKTGKKKLYRVDGVLFEDSKANPYLPSNVIALYSGEDLRLWDNFYFPKYDSYLKDVYQKGYAGKIGMYYVNKYLWNIALLILLTFSESFSNIKDFLQDELGIQDDTQIRHIRITFDYKDYDKNKNNLLKNFINTINPKQDKGKEYTLQEWRNAISSSVVDFDADPVEIFNFLMQAFMPKAFKIIEKIHITFTNGITLESLSEGEKKLILIKAVLEFVADENSILLLDEPDANIHEARKSKLYNLLKNTPNRDVVMTTHSPIIAKIASEYELIYLVSKNGNVSEVSTDKLNLVKKLSANEWNIMEAGGFLNSEKPLILFEGKSDIDFVKRAIELLKEDEPKYGSIDVDFLCFNGTGNAKDFLKNIRTITETKRVIFLFDRDDGGKKGVASISEKSQDDETIVHFNDFVADDKNIKVAFLPYSQGISEGDFMIEDYFSNDLLESIINKISKLSHPVTKLPKIGEGIKKELASDYMNYGKSDFEGFKPLLNKLLELLEIT